MYNGEKEDRQKCLDYLCKAIMETCANGSEQHNHVQELRLLERKDNPNLRYDTVVRPIWSDNPERNDGYYDINVSGDSAWGMIKDVVNYLNLIL